MSIFDFKGANLSFYLHAASVLCSVGCVLGVHARPVRSTSLPEGKNPALSLLESLPESSLKPHFVYVV